MSDADAGALVRSAHAHWNEVADPAGMFDGFWDDDIEWTEPATSPNAGTYRGKLAVLGYLRDWIQSIGRSEHAIEEQVVVGDEVMSEVRISVQGPRSGVAFDAPLFFVEHVREGKITQVRVFYDRAEALGTLRSPDG